jgi:1,3,6,8-tetrahydroxynaphthalene synthase
LINEMGFESTTRQLPIAQLGCAAGGAAINRAHDFCAAYPEANALIVACEFCSLCNGSYLIPKTEEWIMYGARATGFHFQLDKRVPATMEPLAPALQDLAGLHGWDAVHEGGPRILDDPAVRRGRRARPGARAARRVRTRHHRGNGPGPLAALRRDGMT